MVAVVAPLLSAAQADPCSDAWHSLPELFYDETYLSPHDADVASARMSPTVSLRAHHLWGAELNNAARSLVAIRQALNTWTNGLTRAERLYWQDFDDDQRVAPETAKELAYWFAKREVWADFRAGMNSIGSQFGAGDAMSFIMGGTDAGSFLPPGEINLFYGEVSSDSIEFQDRLQETLRFSFLLNSACAPSAQGSKTEQILYDLLIPIYDPANLTPFWSDFLTWANAEPGRIELTHQVLSDIPLETKYQRSRQIVASVITGELDSGRDYIRDRYMARTGFDQVMQWTPRPSFAQNGENGFVIEEFSIVGASHSDVVGCARGNWDAIRTYFFDQTAAQAGEYMYSGEAQWQYLKTLGLVSIIGCGSANGLDDPRVSALIDPYR